MRTLAVLPVKTFGLAKQRLSERLDAEARAALAEAMLGDVLDALRGARTLDGIAVVTAEPRAAAVAVDAGAEVVADTRVAGQSPAAEDGIARAEERGCVRVLLVPGDTPLLDPAQIDELLARASGEGPCVTIVPDRHGTGTNGLVISPPRALAPSFGPGSLSRHLAAARAASIEPAVERLPALEYDVDTPEDLLALAARLETGGRRTAPRTRAALAHLPPRRPSRAAGSNVAAEERARKIRRGPSGVRAIGRRSREG